MRIRRKTSLRRNEGYIGTVVVFILIAAVAVYYLRSGKEQPVDIGFDSNDYVDQNVFALNTTDLLGSEELSLSVGETKTIVNRNYSLKIKKGKDFDADGNLYSPYLIEVFNEKTPLKAYEYFALGVPLGENIKNFYIVSFREKRAR